MTNYIDPTAPSTTVYDVQDGIISEEAVAAIYPDFSFNDMIPEPTTVEFSLMTRANFPFYLTTMYGFLTQGAVTLTVRLDGIPIIGLQDIQFGITPAEHIAAPGQTVLIGQRLSYQITDGQGTPRNFEYTLAAKRS